MSTIVNVNYVSIWDGGTEILTSAKYDTESKLVFDVEVAEGIDEDGDEVQVLDEEYILLPNEEKLSVHEYNGEYRTHPPLLYFVGETENLENYKQALNQVGWEHENTKVDSVSLDEVEIETHLPYDYEMAIEMAREHRLKIKK